MLDRIKNLRTTGAGVAAAVVALSSFFGFGLNPEITVVIVGLIGTIVGLFAKD